jgi:protein phosphatase 1G
LQDAHNAILKYDDDTSLFGVYDGHGGHEVAIYTAKKLPNYIKTRKDYRLGKLKEGLVEAFVEFDRTIIDRDVVRELRVIAGKEAEGVEEVDHEEVDNLFQEATMPIEAVIAKNGDDEQKPVVAIVEDNNKESKSSSAGKNQPNAAAVKPNTAVTNFKTRNGGGSNPISPFLRAKPGSESSDTDAKKSDVKTEDASAKLSFNEDEKKEKSNGDHAKKNGEKEKSNGHKTEGNGHKTEEEEDEEEDEEKEVVINGESKSVGAAEAVTVKGKGKGKGKGKSSQIVKAKPSGSEEDIEEEEISTTEASPKTKNPAKSAAELYHKLVNDEVMDEESEEDEEDDDAFGNAAEDDDDDDTDDEAEEELDDTDEEDSADDEEDDDGEELIGGEFNEEVSHTCADLLIKEDLTSIFLWFAVSKKSSE